MICDGATQLCRPVARRGPRAEKAGADDRSPAPLTWESLRRGGPVGRRRVSRGVSRIRRRCGTWVSLRWGVLRPAGRRAGSSRGRNLFPVKITAIGYYLLFVTSLIAYQHTA